MSAPKFKFSVPAALSVITLCLFSSLFGPDGNAHGVHSAESTADLRATMEMLRAIAEGAPEMIDSPSAATASVRVGGHTVSFDGSFHRIFRAMIRNYDQALRKDCETCATWNPEDFEESAEELEPVIVQSFIRRKLIDPSFEMGEHVAFGAGKLGGELGLKAFNLKVIGELLESALSVLWAKFLGPIHFLCPAIDAMIAFGSRGVNSWGHVFSQQGMVGRSPLRGISGQFRYAYLSSVASRATRRATFEMGPFDVDEAQLAELELGGKKWWGFTRPGKLEKFLRSRQVGQNENQSFALKRKQLTSKRMKRFLFMVTRPSYLGSSRPLDKVLAKPQLWVLAAQERILEKTTLPRAAELPVIEKQTTEFVDSVPYDEVREGLAKRYAGRGEIADAETFERMLRSVELIFNPSVPKATRKFHATFIEVGLRALVYGRTASLVEDKADLVNDGGQGVFTRMKDVGRHFSLGWRTGLTSRFMAEYFDSLKLAAGESSVERLFVNKHASMELMLKIWKVLGQNTEISEIESPEQLEQYKSDILKRYRELSAFRPWPEKTKSAFWLPFAMTLRPWSHPRTAYGWLPFYRNQPVCRDLHVEEH